MKRILAVFMVFCLSLPILVFAEGFSIRNGITWGMTIEQVKAKLYEDGYDQAQEIRQEAYKLSMLLYDRVSVSDLKSKTLFVFNDDSSSKNKGLIALLYIVPGYSSLSSDGKTTDYDRLLGSLQKKYGKPSKKTTTKNNPSNASMLYRMANPENRLAKWQKKEVLIELHMDDQVKDLFGGIEDFVSTSHTNWIAYYHPLGFSEISKIIEANKADNGL